MKRAPLGFTRGVVTHTKEIYASKDLAKDLTSDFQNELKVAYQSIVERQNSIENALAMIEEKFKALELRIFNDLAYFQAKLSEYDQKLQKEAEDLSKKEDEILEAIQQEKARVSDQFLADAMKKKEIFDRKTKERLAEQTSLDLKRQELDEEEKALQEEQERILAQLAKRRETK